jgi:hypothetical protein
MNHVDLAQTIEEWRDLVSAEEEGPVSINAIDISFINEISTLFCCDKSINTFFPSLLLFCRKNLETSASLYDTYQLLES